MSKNLIKFVLNKLVEKFETVKTDKAELIIDGPVEIGKEVLIEAEEGMIQPMDGEYLTETEKIKIENGVITEIEKIEVEEQPTEEKPEEVEAGKCKMEVETEIPEHTEEKPVDDEKDTKIAELEKTISEKDAEIEALKAKIAEIEAQNMRPLEEPVKMSKTLSNAVNSENKALKYFNN